MTAKKSIPGEDTFTKKHVKNRSIANSIDENEFIDVVDENDILVAKAFRSEVHSNPLLIHRSIAVVIINDSKQILLQKRSIKKDTYPGFWAPSCSGHVALGEAYITAALRELREELGLNIKQKNLQLAFKHLLRLPNESEYMSIYLYNISSQAQQKIKPNKQEIDSVRFIHVKDIYQKYGKKITPDLQHILEHLFPTKL